MQQQKRKQTIVQWMLKSSFVHFLISFNLCRELLKRKLDGLPFFNDLGLLALNYQVSDKDKLIFDGPSTGNMKSLERLKTILFTVSVALDSSFTAQKTKYLSSPFSLINCRLEQEFDKFFANAEDEKVKYSINPPTVIEFLTKNFGEDHITVKCFKASSNYSSLCNR